MTTNYPAYQIKTFDAEGRLEEAMAISKEDRLNFAKHRATGFLKTAHSVEIWAYSHVYTDVISGEDWPAYYPIFRRAWKQTARGDFVVGNWEEVEN